jgi:hypothetical protein
VAQKPACLGPHCATRKGFCIMQRGKVSASCRVNMCWLVSEGRSAISQAQPISKSPVVCREYSARRSSGDTRVSRLVCSLCCCNNASTRVFLCGGAVSRLYTGGLSGYRRGWKQTRRSCRSRHGSFLLVSTDVPRVIWKTTCLFVCVCVIPAAGVSRKP